MNHDFPDARKPFPSVDDESKRRFTLAAGLICLLMACSHFLQPQATRPTGRWSFLFGPIWDAFGPTGLFVYWAVLGFGLLGVWFFRRRKSQ